MNVCLRCGDSIGIGSICAVCEAREAKAAMRCTMDAAEAIKAARRPVGEVVQTIDQWPCGSEEMRLVRLSSGGHRVEAKRLNESWRNVRDDSELLVQRIEQLKQLLGLS